MNKVGWIKIYRRFLEWEWYHDINVRIVFLHLLLSANHEPKKWQGNLILKGQIPTSLASLSDEIGISKQEIRTSLVKLESTGEIKKSSTHRYTLITVCNYDSYQAIKESINTVPTHSATQQSTHNQHAGTPANIEINGKPVSSSTSKATHSATTPKEEKEEIKKKYIKKKIFKPPTLEEVKSFFEKNGYREEVAVRCFHHYDLADWHDAQGNPVKSWKQKIHTNWFSPKNLIQEEQKRKLQL